jgi:hypothetical protein
VLVKAPPQWQDWISDPLIIAHFNLRESDLPYKSLIAEVILDKNPHLKTVINKIEDVGADSQFRTFPYEVLRGPHDLNVEVKENGCIFEFDYSKVYWNSKLEKEHTRLIEQFQPGEVVCDVMAGIGPFAVPAGKAGVFVWANDYNPESFHYLKEAITRNKVCLCFTGHTRLFRCVDRRRSLGSCGPITKTAWTSSSLRQIQSSPPQRTRSVRSCRRSSRCLGATPNPDHRQPAYPSLPPSRTSS